MEPLPKNLIAWVAAGIAAATVVVVIVLLWWAEASGLEGEKLVTVQFVALRTGLSIGLGGGGLFALYLAWRRQRSTEVGLAQKQQDQAAVALAYALQERTALASEADAAARRITDLYTKAVEQIGSDKAPVRLGGLYALERLGQDTDSQRETIMNVMCAYLRMPAHPTSDFPDDAASEDERERHAPHLRVDEEEYQVRLTAIRILCRHRRLNWEANPLFWSGTAIDLTGADLANADLADANLYSAYLARANLYGAILAGADLTGSNLSNANLVGARVVDAKLSGAFLPGADLTRAVFAGANLSGANLSGAILTGANFIDTVLTGANLFGADLTDAGLVRADLRRANLTRANLTRVDLTRANLADAILPGATSVTQTSDSGEQSIQNQLLDSDDDGTSETSA